jgi:hypothetical protein
MIERRVLIGTESFQVDRRSITRHSDELLPGDEPAAAAKRD